MIPPWVTVPCAPSPPGDALWPLHVPAVIDPDQGFTDIGKKTRAKENQGSIQLIQTLGPLKPFHEIPTSSSLGQELMGHLCISQDVNKDIK